MYRIRNLVSVDAPPSLFSERLLAAEDLSLALLAIKLAELREVEAEPGSNTKGYSSTDLAMGFANVRAGTRYPPEH